ncbi:MAG: UDP-N-acetylglucosamine 1-carboxyvinyltransferase [Firmicutes bacterium]|nr:UDP-N-acetylglucosamine 1-carboxyvinyltransferase [Bacillota bacterium]
MDSIHIWGGVALQGEVCIQGSKNATLPILAATLLTGECSYIKNCPRISDVYAMASLLQSLGCTVNWQENGLLVDSSRVKRGEMCSEAVRGMRSSLCLLGAMLGRCSEVVMEHPGGCVIGSRPIDLHIAALEQMGVEFQEEKGLLKASADRLHGARLTLPKPSVGATENIILAGVMAEGDTVLEGAAREPEITALCRYLERCGAGIEGIGSSRLVIKGGRALYGTDFEVPADRIVAGTYLLACIGTGGCIFLEKAPGDEMEAVIKLAERMGGKLYVSEKGIYVQGPDRPRNVERIETAAYPGFPTDLQSVALAVETIGEGETVIEEKIFENRFRVVEELRKMGASIEQTDETKVLVKGVPALQGAVTEARELRGGAALTVAGLLARGKTCVSGCLYVYRGYENICRDFRELGARIISV